MSTKKVCFIIPSLDPGGIETYLLRFLRFKDYSFEPVIIVRTNRRGELFESYSQLGVTIHFMPLGYANPKQAYRYFSLLKKISPDVVCDFNANFAGLSLLLSSYAGIKKRIAFYRQGKNHFTPSFFRNNYNEWSRKMVNKYATRILANSEAALNFFFPHRGDDARFKVIYNGVDAKPYLADADRKVLREGFNIPQDAFVVGHSGRLDPAKNHPAILKAAQKLISNDPNIYFVFCGLNTEKLADEVRSMGIENNVRLLGFRKDVPDILKTYDMYYFPSITEGQPNALIEAILSGLPFVASDIKPIQEIVPKHLHNNLVAPTDVEEAVKAINTIKTNYDSYDTLADREWAKDFFSPAVRFGDFETCLTTN